MADKDELKDRAAELKKKAAELWETAREKFDLKEQLKEWKRRKRLRSFRALKKSSSVAPLPDADADKKDDGGGDDGGEKDGEEGEENGEGTTTTRGPPVIAQSSGTVVVPPPTEIPDDLPPGWEKYTDPKTKKPYYYNTETRKTAWIRPEKKEEKKSKKNVVEETNEEQAAEEPAAPDDDDNADDTVIAVQPVPADSKRRRKKYGREKAKKSGAGKKKAKRPVAGAKVPVVGKDFSPDGLDGITRCCIKPGRAYSRAGISEHAIQHFRRLGVDSVTFSSMYAVFRRCDADGSGEIDIDEFLAFFKLETAFARRAFTTFDRDGSGEMDVREFVVSCWHFCALDKQTLCSFVFDLYDDDGGGTIDLEELQSLLEDIYGNRRSAEKDSVMRELERRRRTAQAEMVKMRSAVQFGVEECKAFGRNQLQKHAEHFDIDPYMPNDRLRRRLMRFAYDYVPTEQDEAAGRASPTSEEKTSAEAALFDLTVQDFFFFLKAFPSLLRPALVMQEKIRHRLGGHAYWVELTDFRLFQVEEAERQKLAELEATGQWAAAADFKKSQRDETSIAARSMRRWRIMQRWVGQWRRYDENAVATDPELAAAVAAKRRKKRRKKIGFEPEGEGEDFVRWAFHRMYVRRGQRSAMLYAGHALAALLAAQPTVATLGHIQRVGRILPVEWFNLVFTALLGALVAAAAGCVGTCNQAAYDARWSIWQGAMFQRFTRRRASGLLRLFISLSVVLAVVNVALVAALLLTASNLAGTVGFYAGDGTDVSFEATRSFMERHILRSLPGFSEAEVGYCTDGVEPVHRYGCAFIRSPETCQRARETLGWKLTGATALAEPVATLDPPVKTYPPACITTARKDRTYFNGAAAGDGDETQCLATAFRCGCNCARDVWAELQEQLQCCGWTVRVPISAADFVLPSNTTDMDAYVLEHPDLTAVTYDADEYGATGNAYRVKVKIKDLKKDNVKDGFFHKTPAEAASVHDELLLRWARTVSPKDLFYGMRYEVRYGSGTHCPKTGGGTNGNASSSSSSSSATAPPCGPALEAAAVAYLEGTASMLIAITVVQIFTHVVATIVFGASDEEGRCGYDSSHICSCRVCFNDIPAGSDFEELKDEVEEGRAAHKKKRLKAMEKTADAAAKASAAARQADLKAKAKEKRRMLAEGVTHQEEEAADQDPDAVVPIRNSPTPDNDDDDDDDGGATNKKKGTPASSSSPTKTKSPKKKVRKKTSKKKKRSSSGGGSGGGGGTKGKARRKKAKATSPKKKKKKKKKTDTSTSSSSDKAVAGPPQLSVPTAAPKTQGASPADEDDRPASPMPSKRRLTGNQIGDSPEKE